jgi:hypothetical protein
MHAPAMGKTAAEIFEPIMKKTGRAAERFRLHGLAAVLNTILPWCFRNRRGQFGIRLARFRIRRACDGALWLMAGACLLLEQAGAWQATPL